MEHQKRFAKFSELLVIGLICLMFIAMCAEADIYVPAFPQMLEYFRSTEDRIQLILSLDFAGLCSASVYWNCHV